ncbi:MAG TPA: SET domain-containing protein [Thermosynechococcaceae cyanobacterium]
MIHPWTELRFINDSIGYGVFATQFIPKGTIVWALDDLDQRFSEAEVAQLDPILRERLLKYCYRDEVGQYILCWDSARYVNHSFNSSCIATPYKLELAARDIRPGEELTDDYSYFNLDRPFRCLPEPGTTRRVIQPEDFLTDYPTWDRKAAAALRHFYRVAQPLQHLIDRRHRDKITAIAAGKATMDSMLTCYYDRGTPQKNHYSAPSSAFADDAIAQVVIQSDKL